MLDLKGLHHVAIICSNLESSKRFYTELLGFTIRAEYFREDKNSYKTDLQLKNTYLLELFSFPSVPARPSHPEAAGLRHIAFSVSDIQEEHRKLVNSKIEVEDIRTDEYSGKKFFFFKDPDGLPIELYESLT
jgi:glyoxylase I family protein